MRTDNEALIIIGLFLVIVLVMHFATKADVRHEFTHIKVNKVAVYCKSYTREFDEQLGQNYMVCKDPKLSYTDDVIPPKKF